MKVGGEESSNLGYLIDRHDFLGDSAAVALLSFVQVAPSY